MNKLLPVVLAAIFVGSTGTLARAQDNILAELYGQGVHAYFAGNYKSAHEMLTSAIEQGSQDPRGYYYRGLAYHRLGRQDEGNSDFRKGAVLEFTNTDRIYPVSDSLQRVQGNLRVQLERQRQLARLAVKIRANQIEQARYHQAQPAAQDAVRRPKVAPKSGSARPATTPPATETSDPFASEGQVKPEKAPAKAPPAATPTTESGDVFGEVTPEKPTTATPATKAEATEETPKADSESNPFSDDMPEEEKTEESTEEKPTEEPAEDNPFGA